VRRDADDLGPGRGTRANQGAVEESGVLELCGDRVGGVGVAESEDAEEGDLHVAVEIGWGPARAERKELVVIAVGDVDQGEQEDHRDYQVGVGGHEGQQEAVGRGGRRQQRAGGGDIAGRVDRLHSART